MNLTTDKTFGLKMPDGVTEARELVSGWTMNSGAPINVPPRSTVVVWLEKLK